MKRSLDFLLSILGLLLLSPLFLVISVAIKCSDGGAIFFRQERLGYRRKVFRIWKFRTMTEQAQKLGSSLTVGDDPRVTRVGKWLRRLKLDELPQLINVVRGEMSLVGPRPEVPAYLDLYQGERGRIFEVRPGITDPASLFYRSESEILGNAADPEKSYREKILPHKISLSLAYREKATLWSDIQVMVATLGTLFRRDHAG